jgi:hypothetical protein
MRYVHRDGKLVPKHLAGPKSGPLVISDIEPFQTQDGTPITSRSALRDYERKMGVRQVGNDWTGPERPPFWDRVEQRRAARGRD